MQTIIGMFSRKDEAQKAVQALRNEGISPADIRLIDQEDEALRAEVIAGENQRASSDTGSHSHWKSGLLVGLLLGAVIGLIFGIGILALPGFLAFLPTSLLSSILAWAIIGAFIGALVGLLFREHSTEAETLKARQQKLSERTLVSVRSDDSQADQAIAILRRLNPLSIERSAGDWPAERQTSPQPQFSRTAIPVTGQQATMTGVQEELEVGKREVQGERKRISTFIETEPVEKEVALRQERIEMERQRANARPDRRRFAEIPTIC